MRKKVTLTMAILATSILCQAQDVLHVYRNDGQYYSFPIDNIESMDYEYDEDGNCVSQVIHATDTTYTVPISAMVSVSFVDEEEMHPHPVDLGLPSGTKWASCNIGSDFPENIGDYYAWGEDYTKNDYQWWTYKYFDDETYELTYIGYDICGSEYDVSRTKWGSTWKLPSSAEIQELISKCQKKSVTLKGMQGILFTGPNGNTIFLPLGGSYVMEELSKIGVVGEYWTGTATNYNEGYARILFLQSGQAVSAQSQMCIGRNVRPVTR